MPFTELTTDFFRGYTTNYIIKVVFMIIYGFYDNINGHLIYITLKHFDLFRTLGMLLIDELLCERDFN